MGAVFCFWIVTVCGVTFVSGANSIQDDLTNIMKSEEIMDVSDLSIYYDLKTNQTIKQMLPRPWYWPGWMLRLPFQGGPCECHDLDCVCCTGLHIFNFSRKSCAYLNYDPEQVTINMEVMMQNTSVYKNSFSASNPPPFCIPVPVPYLPPGLVDMCVRLFNVTLMDQKLHVCLDIDSRIDKSPVLVLHFDCMNMGSGGVAYPIKPGDAVTPAATVTEPEQTDSDVYDPVTETTTTAEANKMPRIIKTRQYYKFNEIKN